jgi:hypothetical protein
LTVTVLGARALAQPADKLTLDRLIVGLGVPSPQILAHQLHAGVEEVEREPKRSGRIRRDGHAEIVTPRVHAPRRKAQTSVRR